MPLGGVADMCTARFDGGMRERERTFIDSDAIVDLSQTRERSDKNSLFTKLLLYSS